MTKRLGLLYCGLFFGLSFCACSVNQTGGRNYAFTGVASTSATLYTGEPINSPPAYGVFSLSNPLASLITDFNDSVQLDAYSDNKCTTKATGTLTAIKNPVSLDQGIADFAGAFYQLKAALEENIYFQASLVTSGISICGSIFPVIHHFNVGKGYLHAGSPNAANTSTASAFGNKGVVMRIDSSGRFVVAGTSFNGTGQEMAIWRYLPDGTLDTTLNGGTGFVHFGTIGAAGATANHEMDNVVDLQIDSAGRYIVLGTSANGSGGGFGGIELTLWRYKDDGTLDSSFGNHSGTYHSGAPGLTGVAAAATIQDLAKSMQLDSSQNIVVTGSSRDTSGNYQLFVARFSKDGILDATFASNGVYSKANGAAGAAGGTRDDGSALQIDSTGNYIVAGSSDRVGGGTELAVWRLKSSGVLDSTFGNSGIVLFGTTGAAKGTLGPPIKLNDQARSLQIDQDGSYIIAGTSENPNSGKEMALWRYLPTGQLDSSFAGSGSLHFNPTSGAAGATGSLEDDVGVSLVVDKTNKKYIIAGSSNNANPVTPGKQVAIWRYNNDGSLDTSFNSSGFLTTSSAGAAGGMTAATVNDISSSILFDSVNASYIIVGSTKNSSGGTELAIWRYLNSGKLDL